MSLKVTVRLGWTCALLETCRVHLHPAKHRVRPSELAKVRESALRLVTDLPNSPAVAHMVPRLETKKMDCARRGKRAGTDFVLRGENEREDRVGCSGRCVAAVLGNVG